MFGANRTGKTTCACTFPKPLLLVSFEPTDSGGATSVKRVPGVHFLHLQSSEKGARLCNEIKANCQFKTVVVDSVTSYQDIVLQEICGFDELPVSLSFGKVTGDQYTERAEKTKEGLRMFKSLPCNVVFIGKEKDHNPPKEEKVGKSGKIQPDIRPRFLRGMQQESIIATDLGGSTAGWLHDVCDWAFRLYFDKEIVVDEVKMRGDEPPVRIPRETGKHVRCLRTMYHPNYWCGCRAEFAEAVPECIENPTYDRILQMIRGQRVDGGHYPQD